MVLAAVVVWPSRRAASRHIEPTMTSFVPMALTTLPLPATLLRENLTGPSGGNVCNQRFQRMTTS